MHGGVRWKSVSDSQRSSSAKRYVLCARRAGQQQSLHAIFPSRRGLLPAVRQLIDYLAAEFEQLVDEDQPSR